MHDDALVMTLRIGGFLIKRVIIDQGSGARFHGPFFLRVMRKRRFVIVVTDYFSRWAEADALVNIRDVNMKKFV